MPRVFHVLHHSTAAYGASWAATFLGWHAETARQLAARTSKYSFEVLSFEPISAQTDKNEGGIKYSMFPRTFNFNNKIESSNSLLAYLKTTVSKNDIIHIHGVKSFLTYKILQTVRSTNVVIQDHGSRPSIIDPLFYHAMRKVDKNVRMVYALTTPAKQYFQRSLNLPKNKVSIQATGVDLAVFQPLSMEASRVATNLPSTGQLLLYSGQFNDFKGLPQIIKAVNRLKRKFDVDLVAVGGTTSDSLYQYVKKQVRYVYPRLNHTQMMQFYAATNALTYFWKNNVWGGTSVSVMEAMACNRGIVSNTLQFSPIPESPEDGCYIPKTPENIEQKLTDFLNNSSQIKTRNIAQRYFSWDTISKKTLHCYDTCS